MDHKCILEDLYSARQTFSSVDMTYTVYAKSVGPDQTANMCHLIGSTLFIFSFIISDQEVRSVDPDQTAYMSRLLWIYSGHIIM
jgi:hypothetical protein